MSDIETELKRMIVDTLMLEDLTVDQIDNDAPLFGGGLGLDSIDALELALAISKRFGVRITADDERNKEIFRTVGTLATFISAETRRAQEPA
ncbi:MAG: phosphopantetheine-binding protein [Bacteroidota bacterium]